MFAMGKFIPVEPEKWAEMVKAMGVVKELNADIDRLRDRHGELCAENARLKAEVDELKSQPDPLTAYLYAAELAKDDIKKLKAEVERLTELNATLSLRYDATKSMLEGCAKEIEEMEAEVENSKRINTELLVLSNRQASDIRGLTKAGDCLEDWIAWKCDSPAGTAEPIIEAWNAAKEGGQP